ncbi:hypothetical protein CVT26_000416 [Gymnopilus dilepis]|uniref:Uncharacterized protein n=1 Tax=Gymnopilus dilepis TaxID=231916 RepID=A0A409Y285_9AGAR|nr:hypothetical protein CVT26_000416 [Gymnopilus dilepis]
MTSNLVNSANEARRSNEGTPRLASAALERSTTPTTPIHTVAPQQAPPIPTPSSPINHDQRTTPDRPLTPTRMPTRSLESQVITIAQPTDNPVRAIDSHAANNPDVQFSIFGDIKHEPSDVQNPAQSISAVSSPSSSSSRIGQRSWRNAGHVGQAKSNGELIQFYYTVANGPTKVSGPGRCCRPPEPGDLYFHQVGRLKKCLDKCQVFFFTGERVWEDITDAYYTWDREPIDHPTYLGYVLNVLDKDLLPSYVQTNTWKNYRTQHLNRNRMNIAAATD